MGMAFRIMLIALCLNLAVPIIQYAGGTDNWTTAALSTGYNGTAQVQQFQGIYNTSSNVPVENINVVWYRSILDLISIGFFTRIVDFLKETIFALPTFFANLGVIDIGIIPYINSVLTMLYILGMWELFTGRDLTFR